MKTRQKSTELESTIIFDQYSRYKTCAEILQKISPKGATVLDVGSGEECLLGRFLPRFRVTYVDPLLSLHLEGRSNLIGADVFSSELDGQRFDYVVSVDTIEHIPAQKRNSFLDRICSLARRGIVLACPCSDIGEALETDETLNDLYHKFAGRNFPWLEDHFRYGLPRLSDIRKKMTSLGLKIQVAQNGHASWLRELLGFVICALDIPSQRPVVMELSEHFNRELYLFDHQSPCYRQVILAWQGEIGNFHPKPKLNSSTKTKAARAWRNISKKIPKTIKVETSDILDLQQKLEETRIELGEWGTRVSKEVQQRDARVLELQKQFGEQSEWIQKLLADVQERDHLVRKFQQEAVELGEWAQKLLADVQGRDHLIQKLHKEKEETGQELVRLAEENQVQEQLNDSLQREKRELHSRLIPLEYDTATISRVAKLLVRRSEEVVRAGVPRGIKRLIGPVYRRLNFAPLSKFASNSPLIKSLRPSLAKVGQVFNAQPSGEAAITIEGKNFDHTSCICLDGEELETSYVNRNTISALVPPKFYSSPRSISVEVRTPNLRPSNQVHLTILPLSGEAVDSTDTLIQKRYGNRFETRSKYDIICFPITSWSFRFQRTGQLLRRFARRGHRIFFVHSEFTPAGVSDPDKLSELALRYTLLEENIWQVQLVASSALDIHTDHLSERDNDFILASLHRLVLKMQVDPAVCLVCFPFWTNPALELSRRYKLPVVYDCMDDHGGFGNVSKQTLAGEGSLLREADLVLFSSQTLWDKHSGLAESPLLIRNAADLDHFRNPPRNGELEHLPHPIIGYYGAIAEWFDVQLMEEVITTKPDWSFVFIGHTFGADVSSLQKYANVHFLGEKPYADLPSYLYHFDVCTIPFRLTDLIKATNPVKFYEYLSSGKPVIATHIPELEKYKDVVYLVATAQEFIEAVDQAMHEAPDRKELRKQIASENTWENRCSTLEPAVRKLVEDCEGREAERWKQLKVTVLILTYRGRDYLSACLGSIRKQTHPDLEILLVDNASQDGGPEYVRKNFPEVRVLSARENLGFAKGNNWGMQFATGDAIFFLNDDTELAPNTIEELCKTLLLDDKIAGVCGTVLSLLEKEKVIFTLPKVDGASGKAFWINQESPLRRVDYLSGNSMLIRRGVLDEVGLFDEHFSAYYEETDLCARILRAGYDCVYTPMAKIWHKEIGSGSSDRRYYLIYRNRFRFAMKNFDLSALPLFLFRYSADLVLALWGNIRDRRGKKVYLLLKGVAWNIINLPEILVARYRSNLRIRRARSYSRELPLRNIVARRDGTFTHR